MLTKEQIAQIKEQLFKQLDQWPESQREEAKAQIESMNEKDLEEFLVKNNLIKTSQQGEQAVSQQCTFCMIVQGKIPSYKIAENNDAIAILEINPISKGHVIIIPKQHVKAAEIPKPAMDLANQVIEKIKSTLNPKKIELAPSELFEHGIVNVLPIYKDETFESERKKADEKELKELQEQLSKEIIQEKAPERQPELEIKKPKRKPRKKTKKQLQAEIESLPKAPRRQP